MSLDFLVKYDSDGNWKWNRTWRTKVDDEAWSIGIDSLDKIYVCVHTLFHNVSILKYSTSGDLLWDKTWANNSIYQYWWQDMYIDSSDRIYITGYNRTYTMGIYDIFVGKYSIEYPGIFTLTCDSGSLDTDGNFDLTWTSSSGANNYSIYQYSSFITEINDSLILLADQNVTSPFPISGYSNGTYYFIGAAFNNYGNRTSNCIKLTVAIPPPTAPSSFTLSSDAETPDNDGNFTLTWTSSSGANNYSIYQYSNSITEINDSLILLEEEIDSLSLPLSGYSNGEYYFIVVAYNNFGNTFSNNHKIEVEITPGRREAKILGYNLIYLVTAVIGVSSILVYRRLKYK